MEKTKIYTRKNKIDLFEKEMFILIPFQILLFIALAYTVIFRNDHIGNITLLSLILILSLAFAIFFYKYIKEIHELLSIIEQIEETNIEALLTDGNHHKQWYLEAIAKLLKIDLNQIDYDKGIAP